MQAYHAADYDYARAWFSLEEKKLVWIYVDPGRMRVSFVGVGGVGAALFRLSLNLPSNVFHKPTVEHALQELKEKYGLVNITYRVRDLVSLRSRPSVPWSPIDSCRSTWCRANSWAGRSTSRSAPPGASCPRCPTTTRSLLLDDDRLFARVEFAFPYRQYLTEEEPRLRWVHGGFDAAYRLPRRRARAAGAAARDVALPVAQYDRPDLAIKTYDFLRSTTVPALVFVRPVLEVSLGAGADMVSIFQVQRVSDEHDGQPRAGRPEIDTGAVPPGGQSGSARPGHATRSTALGAPAARHAPRRTSRSGWSRPHYPARR